jgi:glycosyltransferase involved in cell wall biosynthesis
MKFSILIPAHNEEKLIGKCFESIRAASKPYPGEVEVIVVLNRCADRTEEIALANGAKIAREDAKCMAKIRNAAARLATGEIIVTIDADSTMSPNALAEVDRLLSSGKYIGGGTTIKPERISLGILISVFAIMTVLWRERIAAGMFWCYRKDFEAVGGFNEKLVSAEDIDFAKRFRVYGRERSKRFGKITKAHITTSCRKFDKFGDWHLLLHLGFARRILTGRDQTAADELYYNFPR